MKRALAPLLAISALSLALSGCFIVSKNKTSNSSQPVTSSPGHKNHGQARKEEVHERNEARKQAKDAAKGKN